MYLLQVVSLWEEGQKRKDNMAYFINSNNICCKTGLFLSLGTQWRNILWNDLMNILFSIGKFTQKHFFMKPLNPYSEDRVCFDRIPNCEKELLRFLKHYESRVSQSSPYFVSEFIQVKKINYFRPFLISTRMYLVWRHR